MYTMAKSGLSKPHPGFHSSSPKFSRPTPKLASIKSDLTFNQLMALYEGNGTKNDVAEVGKNPETDVKPVVQIPERQSNRTFTPPKVAIVYPSAAPGTKMSSSVKQTSHHQDPKDVKAQLRPFVTLSQKHEVATKSKASHDQDRESRDQNTEGRDQDLQSLEQSLKRKMLDASSPLDLSMKKSRDTASPVKRSDATECERNPSTFSFSSVCPEIGRTLANRLKHAPSIERSTDYQKESDRLKRRSRDYVYMKFKVDRMKPRHPNARSLDCVGTARDMNEPVGKSVDMRRMRSDSHLHQIADQHAPRPADSFQPHLRRRLTEHTVPGSIPLESLLHHYVQNIRTLANQNFFLQNGNLLSAIAAGARFSSPANSVGDRKTFNNGSTFTSRSSQDRQTDKHTAVKRETIERTVQPLRSHRSVQTCHSSHCVTPSEAKDHFRGLGDWSGIESGDFPAFGRPPQMKNCKTSSKKKFNFEHITYDVTKISENTKRILHNVCSTPRKDELPKLGFHVSSDITHACTGCSRRDARVPDVVEDIWKFKKIKKYTTSSGNTADVVYCRPVKPREPTSLVTSLADDVFDRKASSKANRPTSTRTSFEEAPKDLPKRLAGLPKEGSKSNNAADDSDDDLLANFIEESEDEDDAYDVTMSNLPKTLSRHIMERLKSDPNVLHLTQKLMQKNKNGYLENDLMARLLLARSSLVENQEKEFEISDLEISEDEDGSV